MTNVIIACDFNNQKELKTFLNLFQKDDTKLFLKLGMELVYSLGLDVVKELRNQGHKVFLDLKLCDIPNTVYKSIKTLLAYKPNYITIHLSGGKEMICKALAAVKNTPTQLIGVSALTSLNNNDISDICGTSTTCDDYAKNLVKLGLENGLHNFVSSAFEVPAIKVIDPDSTSFCPGIRLDEQKGDQKRVATPQQARSLNVDFIVVGREITLSPNPYQTYQTIMQEFNQ